MQLPSSPILVAVFFVQGLAFFAMSVSILVAARPSAALAMARSLWLLAGFGFLHSAASWLELAQQLYWRNDGLDSWVHPLPTVLLVLYCAFLAQFGANVISALSPRYGWLRGIPTVLFTGTAVLVIMIITRGDPFVSRGLVTAEATARYLIYLPAASLSALAFHLQGKASAFDRLPGLRWDCRLAALTFGLFALTGGALVPTSILFWAQNGDGYAPSAIAQLPVQVVRLLLAPVIAWVIVRTLRVFELEHLLEVEELNRQLRRLTQAAVAAQEEERKRIALELHDDTAQLLSSLLVHIKLLQSAHSVEDLGSRCAELMNLATEAAESTRRMAMQLWPVALDDLGLVAALQWHIERFAKREGLKVDMKVSGVTRDIAPEIELAIYRIVQECLRNVARHARASTASVFLECVHGKLRVEIKDDGCGFDPLAVRRSEAGGMGMLGMSERAALVGGTVTFSSRPGSGTTVRVEVPLRTKTTPAMMAEDMAT